MRTFCLLAVIVMAAIIAQAQSAPTPHEYRTVNGQLYNIRYSTNWNSLIEFIHRDSIHNAAIGQIICHHCDGPDMLCELDWNDGTFAHYIAVKNFHPPGIYPGCAVNGNIMVMRETSAPVSPYETFNFGIPAPIKTK